MISSKTYDEYKNVNHDLFDQIPVHWELFKASHLFNNIGSGTTPKSDNHEFYEDGEIFWLTTGDLNDKNLTSCDGKITRKALEEHTALKEYPEGSVAIAMYGATIGKTALLQFRTTTNQACCVFPTSSKIHNKYFHYQLLSLKPYILSLAVGGGQPNINQEILRSLRIIVPKYKEQLCIASFLDIEAAKIDALISEQERLIELLQDKRQAVVSHAVTKGLNPAAPMKDSGVEWMGEVPEHWEVKKASWLFKAEKGKQAQELTQQYCAEHEGSYPVFSGQTKNEGVMGQIDTYEFDVGEVGAILCTTVGAKAMSTRRIENKFSLSQNCMVISPKTLEVNSSFFQYGFQPLFKHERALIPDHMQPSFRMEDFNQFWVQVPPIEEQEKIYQYLNDENQTSASLEAKIIAAVELLQERRSALISAAVTGQIDVRDLVPEQEETA